MNKDRIGVEKEQQGTPAEVALKGQTARKNTRKTPRNTARESKEKRAPWTNSTSASKKDQRANDPPAVAGGGDTPRC